MARTDMGGLEERSAWIPTWFAGRGARGVRPDEGGGSETDFSSRSADRDLVARLEAGRAYAAEVSRAHDHRRAVTGGGHRDRGGRHRTRRRTALQTVAVRRRRPGRPPGDAGRGSV